MSANCQSRHPKLADVKANFYTTGGDGRTRRLRGNRELAAAVGAGTRVVALPPGSRAPSPEQLAGADPLPTGGFVVRAGTAPDLVGARPGRAVRTLTTRLRARGVPATLLAEMAEHADALPGDAATRRRHRIALLDGLAAGAGRDRQRAAVLARTLSAETARVAHRWAEDGDPAGLDAAVGVLADAAARSAVTVRLAAAKLLWDEPAGPPGPVAAGITSDELLQAISDGHVHTVFQPIWRLEGARRRVVAAEALVRWTSPTGQRISPETFVPLAPTAVTAAVLAQTADAVRRWTEHQPPVQVAVNASPGELSPTLADDVAAATGPRETRARQITIEVTETAPISDLPTARRTLEALRARGVAVKLDDFGTGYSRLHARRHLLGLVDGVKLDRSLVRSADRDPARAAVLAVAFRAFPDKRIIVEGVERRGELDLLAGMPARADVQGYLFATPMTGDALTALVGTDEPADAPAHH